MKEKDFPLFVMSQTDPGHIVFVFRENGQELAVNIRGFQPQCNLRLTPEERMYILENFIEKTINHE